MKQVFLKLFTFCILMRVAFPVSSFADFSLEIEGNSPESQNSVEISTDVQVTLEQTNNSQINNDITINTNTGNNSTSSNSSDAAILTGNSDIEVSVANLSNISTATVSTCCDTSTSYSISHSQADNQIVFINSQIADADVTNIASINNKVNIDSSTGGNIANLNTGPATITTGDSSSSVDIGNHANLSNLSLQLGSQTESASISSNNGSGFIVRRDLRQINISVANQLSLNNYLNISHSTGDNFLDLSKGGIIVTGNTFAKANIQNIANVSNISVTSCCQTPSPSLSPSPTPTITVDPTPTPDPHIGGTNPPSSNSSSSSSSATSAVGSILGLAATHQDLTFFSYLVYISGLTCLLVGIRGFLSQIHTNIHCKLQLDLHKSSHFLTLKLVVQLPHSLAISSNRNLASYRSSSISH